MKKAKTVTPAAAPRSKHMTILGRAALTDAIAGSGETAGTTDGSGTTQLSNGGSHGC